MKFSDLIQYFENIAASHVLIQHSSNEKHFFRFEIDEVLGGLNRPDVNFPMLILEGYNFSYTDNRSDNVIKNRQGAFVLLDQVTDSSDFNTKHEKWDELEALGDDIIARIRHDKQARNTIVRGFNIENIEASLILNEYSNHAGIRYTFNISSPASIDVDQTQWLDMEEPNTE